MTLIQISMRDEVEGMRRVNPGFPGQRGKISFSKTEVLHIAIAIAVLTAAFSIVFRFSHLDADPTKNILLIVGIFFVVVCCCFLLHELGHKFVAQRYNAWSEFRIYPAGLFIAIVSSLVGFVFAAPGAVYFRGEIDKEKHGKISLAGPAVNFVIAAISIVIALSLREGTLVFVLFQMLSYFNALMGLFNMIPFYPFDGSKIIAWNIPVYLGALAIGAAEFLIVWFYIMY